MRNKIRNLSTVIATMAVINIFPVNSLAAENKITVSQVKKNVTNMPNKYANLGPDHLKEALKSTGSNILAIDFYSLALIKQPDFDFTGINTINSSLKKEILNQQVIAKKMRIIGHAI
ncbi:hemolytic enterotoxin family protein (plasmid) [Bacillus cereus]|nr:MULTISPECIES: HBL/NHE enterotoxin family protein [Bacillus cereus group]AIY72886.1 hemolytic enterotoxin family protein [Bacillus cereus]AJI08098.1 hemolytic enterotoxin family protein [Bacillus cereus G9241]EAL15959.1 non-hemolytic enterotoxin lytic component L1 [Bacillus cereus G9241]QPS53443.1 HBL/NHE enterotoxin family protein [Bacillus tropicus]